MSGKVDRVISEPPPDHGPWMAAEELAPGPWTAAALAAEYLDFVWRSLRYLGLRGADQEDACQRVWLVLTQYASRIQPDKEKSYIFSVVVRVAKETRRTVRAEHTSYDDDAPAADSHYDGAQSRSARNPEQECEQSKARALLTEMLAELNFDQRAVFVMFEFEGLSTPEIAEALGATRGTIASRLRLAREQFSRKLLRVQAREAGTSAAASSVSHPTAPDPTRQSHTRLKALPEAPPRPFTLTGEVRRG